MPDAIITSTESTFGTISGTFAADQSTITGTVTGIVAGTLSGSVGVPGPAGPGVPAGGTAGQILQKIDGVDYNTDWVTASFSATWGSITGTLSDQTDLQTALNLKAPLASPALTGVPTTPTAATLTSTTQIASTAFVQQELAAGTAVAKNLEVYVRNQTGSTLAAGAIVYINGATGNRPTVTLAQANNDANSAQTFGFVKASIANNGFGYVIVRGELENIDTSALTEGVQLYLSPTTAGAWTTTKPSAPEHLVYVGIVVRSHPTQGVILVAVQNGYELDELHDVSIVSKANNDLIAYDSATTLWKNKSIGTLGLATQAWVDAQGYLQAGALTGYALESWVTAGFYPLTGNPSGFLTSASLTGYATESFVTSQGYITSAALSPYLLSSTAASTYAALAGSTFTGVVGFNGASGGIAAKSTGWFKAYTSGAESTDYSLQYDTGLQVVVGGSTVARIASSGILAPSAGITFSDASTQTTAGVSASTVAATYAPLASPALTGNPTAPTPATADNDTSIATTAFVKAQGYLTSAPVTSVAGRTGAVTLAVADVSGAAPLASPTFTGTVTIPAGASISGYAPLASPTLTGTPAAPTATAGTNTTQIATTAFVRTDNNVKVWVNFNGTGTVAIRNSFNVTSITDNGVGAYTVNYTNAISSNAVGCCMVSDDAASYRGSNLQGTGANNSTTSYKISCWAILGGTSFAQVDPANVMFAAIR